MFGARQDNTAIVILTLTRLLAKLYKIALHLDEQQSFFPSNVCFYKYKCYSSTKNTKYRAFKLLFTHNN